MNKSVNWLARVTIPADDYKFVHLTTMFAPDDEDDFFKHLGILNKDIRLVSAEPFEDQAKYNAAVESLKKEIASQPGYENPDPLFLTLTQEQVDKRKAKSAEARKRFAPKQTPTQESDA